MDMLRMMAPSPDSPPPLWRLVYEKVRDDQIPMRAAALSFHFLFSLLPSLAIVLAVLSGPAFEEGREQVLAQIAEGLIPKPLGTELGTDKQENAEGAGATTVAVKAHREMVEGLKEDLRSTIEKLDSNLGKISLFSFVLLLYVAGKLFNTIGVTFDAIWNVRVGRPFFRRVAVITAVIFWGPVMVALSVSLAAKLPQWTLLHAYLVPLGVTTLAFTAFYVIMPHARVHFRAALLGGFAAAVMWELSKVGFLVYLQYAVGMSALYGSLSLVPIVFLWVYLTWMVVLAGGELAFVVQHRKAMVSDWISGERDRRGRSEAWSAVNREAALLPYLALAATIELVRTFRSGDSAGGVRASRLARALGSDPGSLQRALERMHAGGILVRVAGNEESETDPRYVPGQDISQSRLAEVVKACHGSLPTKQGPSWERAREILDQFQKEGETALTDVTLQTLAEESSESDSRGKDAEEAESGDVSSKAADETSKPVPEADAKPVGESP